MKNNYVVTIIACIIVGALAFYGGMKYASSKATSFAMGTQGAGNVQGARFGRGGAVGMRPTIGEIINADGSSITVKLMDGSSKLVMLNDKTTVGKMTTASRDDLKDGVRVAVVGTTNSDGSIDATSIQLNPTFGGGRGRMPNQAQKSADAKEIVVEGQNYSFNPSKITVKKGEKTRIVFKNKSGFHDFRVDELQIATAVIQSGSEDFVEFTPAKAGTFEFYCGVGDHRAMGMKGTITVE